MYRFICAAILTLSGTAADAMNEISHGTYFIYSKTDRHIIASIDSRVVVSPTNFRDDFCKLIVLNSNLFSLAAGITGLATNGRADFDIYDIIRAESSRAPTEVAKNVITKFLGRISSPPSDLRTGDFTDVFLFDDLESLRVTIGHLDWGPSKVDMTVGTPAPFNRTSGHEELFDEFFNLRTDRAKDMHQKIQGRFGATTDAERLAAIFTGVVQAVVTFGNDPKVGGEAQTIILEKGKPLRWYARPGHCPEN